MFSDMCIMYNTYGIVMYGIVNVVVRVALSLISVVVVGR